MLYEELGVGYELLGLTGESGLELEELLET
jgi:hypothetical protein